MFVDIENYKSPLAIENLLAPYKKGLVIDGVRQPKAQITTDVCFEVLRSTNAPRNIKDMLQCIADLPPSEQAQFKDVVLSTFTQREQPDAVLYLGRKLAVENDFMVEFDEVRKLNEGTFLTSAVKSSKVLLCVKNNDLLNGDLAGYDKLICRCSRPNFWNVDKLPKSLEFDEALVVDLSDGLLFGVESISCRKANYISVSGGNSLKSLKFDDCALMVVEEMDVSQLQSLQILGGDNLTLSHLTNFSFSLQLEDFNYIKVEKVDFCDDVKSLKFSNVENLHISDVFVPENLELSNVRNFVSNSDFMVTETFHFDNIQKIDLSYAKNLPTVLVKNAQYAEFRSASFRSDSDVMLHDVSFATFASVKKMPHSLNLDHCDNFVASSADFHNGRLSLQNVLEMDLSNARNLPSLMISHQMNKLNIQYASFDKGQQLILNGVSKIDAEELEYPPEVIHIAHARELELYSTNLQNTKKITVSNVSVARMAAKPLADETIFENCQSVLFGKGKFNPQTKLILKQIELADFENCETLPDVLDVSDVKNIYFSSLKNVKKLILSDEKQKSQLMSYAWDNFTGEVAYTSSQSVSQNALEPKQCADIEQSVDYKKLWREILNRRSCKH